MEEKRKRGRPKKSSDYVNLEDSRDRARKKYDNKNPQVVFKLSLPIAARFEKFFLEGEGLSKACKRLALERLEQLENDSEEE